jgi:hypothetical protein
VKVDITIRERLVVYTGDALQGLLPEPLRARIEERVFVEGLADDPVTQRFVEIVDAGSGNRVVTVIEVLSPSNKVPGEGQALYRRKQRELEDGRVSLVEVDLLRAGERVLAISPWAIPPSHRTPYQVVVRRGYRSQEVKVYRVPLRERLPIVGVPLRERDDDVPLDLQELVERCYENGRYDATIDYAQPPDPPLEGNDAVWAAELVSKEA